MFPFRAFNISLWSIIFVITFYRHPLFRVRNLHSILTLLRVLITNGCWISSNTFYAGIEMTIWFFFFNLLSCINMNIKPTCTSAINTTWYCCIPKKIERGNDGDRDRVVLLFLRKGNMHITEKLCNNKFTCIYNFDSLKNMIWKHSQAI